MSAYIPGAPCVVAAPTGGPPYWLVRVSGLYLTSRGWLVGDPAKARVWADKAEAMAEAKKVRDRKLWTGRVVVVRRKHLKASQW